MWDTDIVDLLKRFRSDGQNILNRLDHGRVAQTIVRIDTTNQEISSSTENGQTNSQN